MNRDNAIKLLVEYLRSYNIEHQMDIADGTPRITMIFAHACNCPGGVLEGCVYFFNDSGMEFRVYYSELAAEWCRKSEHIDSLYRLLNYINARVWIKGQDGMGGRLYNSVYLYSPRFYMTEDGHHDITATFLVPYEFLGVQALATWDFFTAALPELMNDISPAIFMMLLGKNNVDEAISMIDRAISSQG